MFASVPDRAYPFWPPGSPQSPHILAGATLSALIGDLPVNQVPGGVETEIPFRQVVIPKNQAPEGPTYSSKQDNADVDPSSGFFSNFMAPYNTGGGGKK